MPNAPHPIPPVTPWPEPVPVDEPEPDLPPDEGPVPNPDENREPPKHLEAGRSVVTSIH